MTRNYPGAFRGPWVVYHYAWLVILSLCLSLIPLAAVWRHQCTKLPGPAVSCRYMPGSWNICRSGAALSAAHIPYDSECLYHCSLVRIYWRTDKACLHGMEEEKKGGKGGSLFLHDSSCNDILRMPCSFSLAVLALSCSLQTFAASFSQIVCHPCFFLCNLAVSSFALYLLLPQWQRSI